MRTTTKVEDIIRGNETTKVFVVDFDRATRYVVEVKTWGCKWTKVTTTDNAGVIVQGVDFYTPLEALKDLAARAECVYTLYENGNVTLVGNDKYNREIRASIEDMEVNEWLGGVA
jgi:hypothetical protein